MEICSWRESSCSFSPFQSLRAFVPGYVVAGDESDHFVEDNPFLLSEKKHFPSSQQVNLCYHEITCGVGRSEERKGEHVVDSKEEKNCVIWQQLTFRLDQVFFNITD